MMKPKIALCMIVGYNENKTTLSEALESVSAHVDGIFINFNAPGSKKVPKELISVAKRFNAEYIETKWTNSFVKARNDNFNQVPSDYDWILWLDTDDTVENPEKISEVCAVVSPKVDGIYINYDYAHDEYGNVTVSHYNARVVRNNGTFAWKSSFQDEDVTVHETLNEVRRVEKVMNNEWKVVHHSDDKRRDKSLRRNIELLEGMLSKSKESLDPRILYYLATHYVDAGLWTRAKALFEKYLGLSGWAEERSQAWVYLGDIYRNQGDIKAARGCYSKALAENPKDPAPYVELAELEIIDRLWDKAIEYLHMATRKKVDFTSAIQRPMESTYRAYKLLSQAYVNTGSKGFDKARKYLDKALAIRPYDPELHEASDLLTELEAEAKLTDSILTVVNRYKKDKAEDKILDFIDTLPMSTQTNPLVHSIRNHYRKPTTWAKKSVAIVCGSSAVGSWGPWSLKTGIGGSEEAVIQLSTLLSGMGWDVTVYGIPGTKEGVHNGVNWKHYWEFSSKDRFDIIIGWRDPSWFDSEIKARKKYLWLHDVVDKEELTKQRIDNLTKIIFVSQYHRDLYPDIPDSKCLVSGNGIDPSQFTPPGKPPARNVSRCIYMSAHERGLELLYKIWPDVRKEVPEATLDVYYGWKGFDEINKDNPERMAWKASLLKTESHLKDLGVTNHGKIGHQQIVAEIQASGVWAYPSPFPEVYCISGVKAQAGGAWPVISDYAALKETVKYGDKTPMPKYDERTRAGYWDEKDLEQYKQSLIKRLNIPATDKERTEMMEWAINNMTWAKIAEQWDKEFSK